MDSAGAIVVGDVVLHQRLVGVYAVGAAYWVFRKSSMISPLPSVPLGGLLLFQRMFPRTMMWKPGFRSSAMACQKEMPLWPQGPVEAQ